MPINPWGIYRDENGKCLTYNLRIVNLFFKEHLFVRYKKIYPTHHEKYKNYFMISGSYGKRHVF